MISTIKPDKIVFNLPTTYKLFDNSKNHINYINEELKNYISNKIVYINEIKNDNINLLRKYSIIDHKNEEYKIDIINK
jgi:hypothetical protein